MMNMRTLCFGIVTALLVNSGAPVWAQEATPGTSSAQDSLSPAIADIVKMYKAGVNSTVILTYIDHAPAAFQPTPQDVLRLNDLGIPSEITTALIRHDPNAPRTAYAPPASASPAQPGLPPAVSSTAPATQTAPPIQEPIIVGSPPETAPSSVLIIPGPPTTTYFGSPYDYYPYGYYDYGSRFSFYGYGYGYGGRPYHGGPRGYFGHPHGGFGPGGFGPRGPGGFGHPGPGSPRGGGFSHRR